MTSPSMRTPKLGVSYSDAIAAAYATAPEAEIIYDTLELQHPTFLDDDGNPAPVRIVNDHADLIAGLEITGEMVTFSACYFKFSRPTESAASALPEVALQVDNVAKAILPYLKRAVSSLVPITVIWRPYLDSDLSGPHMLPVLTLSLRSLLTDMNSIQAKAGFSDLSNRRFPGNEYLSKNFPGLTVR